MAIVHRFGGPRNHVHAENRGLIHRFDRRIILLGSCGNSQQQNADRGLEYFHNYCFLNLSVLDGTRPQSVSLSF